MTHVPTTSVPVSFGPGEETLTTGSPQLDASDHILRSSWLIDLPIVLTLGDEEEVVDVSYAEAKVLALHWGGAPTSAADQMIVALPLAAVPEDDGPEFEVGLYQPGQWEATEVAEIKILTLRQSLPAFYLSRRLVEGVPAHASVVTFSAEASGACVASCEVFGLAEIAAPMRSGTLISLPWHGRRELWRSGSMWGPLRLHDDFKWGGAGGGLPQLFRCRCRIRPSRNSGSDSGTRGRCCCLQRPWRSCWQEDCCTKRSQQSRGHSEGGFNACLSTWRCCPRSSFGRRGATGSSTVTVLR
eukprot:5189381-Amphidinium_carterae.1